MTNPARSPDDLIEEAAAIWLVRLSDSPRSDGTQTAFETWLSADPRHGETFDALSRTWEDVAQLKEVAPTEEVGPRRSASGVVARLLRPAPLAKALAFAAAAAIAIAFLPPSLRDPFAPRYATAIAQTHEVRLPDGSVVTLGARSKISYRYDADERRVSLLQGEAFFDVVHNQQLPFVVDAGDAVIRDIGTRFNVRRGAGLVNLSVAEGAVSVVQGRQASAAARVLQKGQEIELRPAPLFAAPTVSAVTMIPVSAVAPWREGRLSYNDAPLRELVADVNRYYAPGVRLSGAEVGDIHVTASFKTSEIPEFLNALGRALPVRVTQARDRSFVLEGAAYATPTDG